jgi:hypothetical protein
MRYAMPNFPSEFEIPDDWLTEADAAGFVPTTMAYRTSSDAVLVPLAAIEPPMYVRAASRLTAAGDEIPLLTLLLFALELALKAYLIDKGTPERTIKQLQVRHDLKELHGLAIKVGLPVNSDVVSVIDEYRDDHKDHSFRYGDRNYVDLGDPGRALRVISAAIDEIGKGLNRKL